MLGKSDGQGRLFSARSLLGDNAVEQLGFYGRLATEGRRLFRDEDFASAYSHTGRPSRPPSMLAIARLLQHLEGISDADVIARCQFDLRWKVALGLDGYSVEAPFAKSTFQAFRARLTLHEQEGMAFQKSIEEALRLKLLPKKLRLALDSSPVRGRGAIKDTFNLLSDAIVNVIRATARAEEAPPTEIARSAGIERHLESPSIKGSELVNWQDEESVRDFLAGLLEDCRRAVAAAEQAGCASEEVALLERVIAQDIDESGEKPAIRKGVETGRVPSVHDPEIRHGRKSSGKTYDGHKGHVGVDTESGLVTAIEVTEPHAPDGAEVQNLVQATEAATGLSVEEALGDSAYGSATAQEQAREAGVRLVSRMPKSRRGGLFGPADFKVGADGRSAVCPAGHASAKVYKSGKRGLLHHWSVENCEACPLRGQCLDQKRGSMRRTLLVGPAYHDRRQREAFAWSAEGRALLRHRVRAEHAIGRLKNLGAGASRHFGRAKTKAQWLWSAAVANLSLLWSAVTTAAEVPAAAG